MSGASRSRNARARALKAQSVRRSKIEEARGKASFIAIQIQLASGGGPRGLVRTTGGGRSGQPIRRHVTVRMPYKGGSRPVTIQAPPASAIPALRRSLQRATLNTQVVRAQVHLEAVSVVPYIPVAKRSLRGSSRLNKQRILAQRASNKSLVSTIFGAKMNLYKANMEVYAFDKGVTVSDLKVGEATGTKTIRVGGGRGRTSSRLVTVTVPPAPIAPFLIQGRSQKIKTLSDQSGFDVGLQLQMTNDRFGLDLSVDDVTANFTTGGLLGEASTIFGRNRKINKLKESLIPATPDIISLDDNSDFDLLYERRASIVDQQQFKLGEINKISDQDLRIARIETDLPQYNERAVVIDGLIGGLETRITNIKKTRKPQELLSATGSLQRFGLKDLVDRRNQLTKIRNQKVDQFNAITDPALRQVSKEQDIPQFDDRIFAIDQDIDRGVKFGESRNQLNIGIINAPTKRKGRIPKTFDVTIGEDTRTFKRNPRGARKAEMFFVDARTRKNKELDAISDPIERQIAKDQDFGVLDLGLKASKTQRKVIKAEKMQELELLNIGGGASAQTGFLPFTPSNTPSGKLAIRPIRKSRNIPKVFDQLDFGRSRGINSNQFDLGRLYGQSRGRTKIRKRQRGNIDFF